jgi:hypothetical protein
LQSRVANRADITLSLALPKIKSLPVTAVENQPPLAQFLNDRIAGYTLLKDIYQQPAALLQIEMPREIYQHGLTSLWYLSRIILVFTVLLSGLILWLFERLVLA